MGACCAQAGKLPTPTRSMPATELEHLRAVAQSVALSLRIKRKTLNELKESTIRLKELIAVAYKQAKDVSQSIADRSEAAERLYSSCIRLLTRISILQSLATNMKSSEFQSLLRSQSIEEVTRSLLSCDTTPSHSLLLAEIKASALPSSSNDSEAISNLKRHKSESKALKESLMALNGARVDTIRHLQGLMQQREELLRSCAVCSTQLLLLKDANQAAVVRSCGFEEELIKDLKTSPVALLEDLLSLESEVFTLNTEVAGLESNLQQSQIVIESCTNKAERCEKMLVEIEKLPVPEEMQRTEMVTVAPKKITEEVITEPMDSESESRMQAMYEEIKNLEKRLQRARESQERTRHLSMKLEEQLETNDFERAELVLRLVARRLLHRARDERMMLFAQWRLASL